MKKLIKYLKIGSCCFALMGVVFGTIYSVNGDKQFYNTLAVSHPQQPKPQNEQYYQSLDEITFNEVCEIKLKHDLNLYSFAYSNPDYMSFNSVSNVVDDYISLIDYWTDEYPVINGITFTDLHFEKYNDHTWYLKLIDINNEEHIIIKYDSNNSLYGSVVNPNLYRELFSGNYSIYTINYSTAYDLKVYKYLAYYYSIYSPNNFTLALGDEFVFNIGSIFQDGNKPYLFNNYFFYSEEIYNSLGSFEGFYSIPLFIGGFRSNSQYFSYIEVQIGSAYYTGDTHTYYYSGTRGGFTGLNPSYDSRNSSLLGYYYVAEVDYINTSRVLYNSDNIATRFDYTNVYDIGAQVDGTDILLGFEYRWTNYAYRDLSIFFVDYSNLENVPYTLYYTQVINILGVLTWYIPPTPERPVEDIYWFTQVFDWINIAFIGLTPMLSFQVMKGISIGTILAVPLVLTLILFIVKAFKR